MNTAPGWRGTESGANAADRNNAQALVDGGYRKQTLWITGPEAFTVRERVRILVDTTGRPVELATLSAVAATTPQDTVLRVTGHEPLTFRTWAEDHVTDVGR